MIKNGKQSKNIIRWASSDTSEVQDVLAIEAPLQIQIGIIGTAPKTLTITMRTPGHDEELAVGFAFAEGIFRENKQIVQVLSLDEKTTLLMMDSSVQLETEKLDRNFLSNSSCGVCGKNSLDFMQTLPTYSPALADFCIHPTILGTFPEKLFVQQGLFAQTGGNHAAALFDTDGHLIALREDVGRHNALDKLLGWAVQNDQLPLSKHILLVSGRASFELVQKASMAGLGFMAAVGAPSSLAVDLAADVGMTLVGFLKKKGHNIYTGRERVALHL